MFKFNFIESGVQDLQLPSTDHNTSSNVQAQALEPAAEVTIDDLVNALPPVFSYSPLHIPLTGRGTERGHETSPGSTDNITLLRRDLFDVRFQIISQSDETSEIEQGNPSHQEALLSEKRKGASISDFIDNPSDLVPGVYEGGLKTWECSLDLVDYLKCSANANGDGRNWIVGRKVLEIGCGTAIPSLYLLREVFSQSRDSNTSSSFAKGTVFHLQDYNRSVLEFVTLPNILLTWYMSPSSALYRASQSTEAESLVLENGELHVTTELISSFLATLREQNISLRFFSGSWDGFPALAKTAPYDIILTSETIYRTSSLPPLINILSNACIGRDAHSVCLESSPELDLESFAHSLYINSQVEVKRDRPLCLVSAKILYFGVGGGVAEFERLVRDTGAQVQTVLERTTGVARRVMKVEW